MATSSVTCARVDACANPAARSPLSAARDSARSRPPVRIGCDTVRPARYVVGLPNGSAGASLAVLPEEPYAYLRRYVGRSGAALHAAAPPDAAKLAGHSPAEAGLLALRGQVQCAVTGIWGW